jgi:hypothetical protein
MSTDPFAFGGDQRDDAALLTLFREWRAGMRDIEGERPAEETEDQYDAACHAVWDIARQIYDTPAAGLVGLAIKAFMLAFEVCVDHLPSSEEPSSLGEFSRHHYGAGDTLYLRNHAIKGLVGDIACFVPEVAPLVGGIVQSPVKRDPAEDRAEAEEDAGPGAA